MIRGRDIGVRFNDGFEAISRLDFQVAEREFVAIVGPSGCGKSTLLRLVAGLEHYAVAEGSRLDTHRTRLVSHCSALPLGSAWLQRRASTA